MEHGYFIGLIIIISVFYVFNIMVTTRVTNDLSSQIKKLSAQIEKQCPTQVGKE